MGYVYYDVRTLAKPRPEESQIHEADCLRPALFGKRQMASI